MNRLRSVIDDFKSIAVENSDRSTRSLRGFDDRSIEGGLVPGEAVVSVHSGVFRFEGGGEVVRKNEWLSNRRIHHRNAFGCHYSRLDV